MAAYEAAIAAARADGDDALRAQALRRLAVLWHHRGDSARAHSLCGESFAVARAAGDDVLAAEALNTLGGMDLSDGSLADARAAFRNALELGGANRALCARVEQNLGILANIRGELDEALRRYRRSLEAYDAAGDRHGCALAYHNLGMVSADGEDFVKADRYFRESREIAEATGDVYLHGLCLINHAEVDVARQRYENAREKAENALNLLDQLGAAGPKADAYRVIGMVYRETGRHALAESRLRSAIDQARAAASPLGEAEAARELALLYQETGRNQEALRLLGEAHRLFRHLNARVDVVDVGGKVAELRATYLAVVRDLGRSIESTDCFTFGHCERVAECAVRMARALHLDEETETTLLLGAYLHDIGMLRVPHEILAKATGLTRAERAIVEDHPIWGVEMLAHIEFPWDIKSIVRWHHERVDGSGYPDHLKGDAIPLTAQIVGVAEYYDALTAPRDARPALTPEQAVAHIRRCRGKWSEPAVRALAAAVASSTDASG